MMLLELGIVSSSQHGQWSTDGGSCHPATSGETQIPCLCFPQHSNSKCAHCSEKVGGPCSRPYGQIKNKQTNHLVQIESTKKFLKGLKCEIAHLLTKMTLSPQEHLPHQRTEK